MKTIEVTDEMYDFLINLSKELNTQDHRATAMPYFYQIQTKEQVAVPEGCGIMAWHQDGSLIETDEEIDTVVFEWKDESVPFEDKEKLENAFLTEKACKKHIELNYYHYCKPVDYLNHAFRNPELEQVLKFICQLTGGELHK
jgi:hypothetical protein